MLKILSTMIPFSFLFVFLISGCSENSPESSNNKVIRVSNLSYIANDTITKHKLDVYYKEGTKSNKVVFFIPGGAWRQGDKDKYQTLGLTLASKFNYTVFVINYRLSNPEDGNAIHPIHIEDVATALKWVLTNIDIYHGDKENIYIFGQSAGAHLATLLVSDEKYLNHEGIKVADIKGVIAMSGAYSLNNLLTFPKNPLGLNAEETLMYKGIIVNAFGTLDSELLAQASPSNFASNSMPPFLLIYSEYDMPGFDKDAVLYHNNLIQFGNNNISINMLYKTDYSEQTWLTATSLASEEPALSDYIGHYAEVVAINDIDFDKYPTRWISDFINKKF